MTVGIAGLVVLRVRGRRAQWLFPMTGKWLVLLLNALVMLGVAIGMAALFSPFLLILLNPR